MNEQTSNGNDPKVAEVIAGAFIIGIIAGAGAWLSINAAEKVKIWRMERKSKKQNEEK